MFDPVSFVLALALLVAASLYVRAKRRRALEREFDGGFRHDNERCITRIRSRHIISHGDHL